MKVSIDNRIPLLGMTPAELKNVAEELALPKFVAKQMADWLYSKCVADIDVMRYLSKAAREKLSA